MSDAEEAQLAAYTAQLDELYRSARDEVLAAVAGMSPEAAMRETYERSQAARAEHQATPWPSEPYADRDPANAAAMEAAQIAKVRAVAAEAAEGLVQVRRYNRDALSPGERRIYWATVALAASTCTYEQALRTSTAWKGMP